MITVLAVAQQAQEAAQVVSQEATGAGIDAGLALGLCILFLLLGTVFLILEFIFISGGLLSAAAAACAAAAVWFAFHISGPAGWVTITCIPVLALIATRWGINRLQYTNLVTQAVIDDNAGYANHLQELGVTVGAQGTMVTTAMPTGRAQFEKGEVDVQIIGGTAEPGTPVFVSRVDGPVAFVRLTPPSQPQQTTAQSES